MLKRGIQNGKENNQKRVFAIKIASAIILINERKIKEGCEKKRVVVSNINGVLKDLECLYRYLLAVFDLF